MATSSFGNSISDLILNQMKTAGQPRTTTQTGVSTTKEPLNWGNMGLLLALILGNQLGKGTVPIAGEGIGLSNQPIGLNLSPSAVSNISAPAQTQGLDQATALQFVMKMLGM